jgi:hypothetical protein
VICAGLLLAEFEQVLAKQNCVCVVCVVGVELLRKEQQHQRTNIKLSKQQNTCKTRQKRTKQRALPQFLYLFLKSLRLLFIFPPQKEQKNNLND